MISIFVPGEPVAKARPGRNKHGFRYKPTKGRKYEQSIAELVKLQMITRNPTKSPVSLDLVLLFEIPKSWPNWKREAAQSQQIAHTSKPDADNVVKSIKDALNKIVYEDDAQVTDIKVLKLYSDSPGVLIDVKELTLSRSQITRKDQLLLPERQEAA